MSVSIGSRSAERGEEIAAQIREKWGTRVPDLHGASNEVACAADLVVVATPWDGAPQTLPGSLSTSTARSSSRWRTPFSKWATTSRPSSAARGSLCVAVQGAAPRALVSGAFHHLPARGPREPRPPPRRRRTCLLGPRGRHKGHDRARGPHTGCRGIDAGTLSAAAAIEAFTAVLIGVNIRSRLARQYQADGPAHRRPLGPARPDAVSDAALRHGSPRGRPLRTGRGGHDVHLRDNAL